MGTTQNLQNTTTHITQKTKKLNLVTDKEADKPEHIGIHMEYRHSVETYGNTEHMHAYVPFGKDLKICNIIVQSRYIRLLFEDFMHHSKVVHEVILDYNSSEASYKDWTCKFS